MKTTGVYSGKHEKQGDGGTETVQETKTVRSLPWHILGHHSRYRSQWECPDGCDQVMDLCLTRSGEPEYDLVALIARSNGNPLQSSHLENPMDRGAWWATVPGVAESDMTEWLNPFTAPLKTKCLQTPKALWKSSGPTLSEVGFNNPLWWNR